MGEWWGVIHVWLMHNKAIKMAWRSSSVSSYWCAIKGVCNFSVRFSVLIRFVFGNVVARLWSCFNDMVYDILGVIQCDRVSFVTIELIP